MYKHLHTRYFRDVEPFITAIENLLSYYRARGVCLFKQAISLPGIAQILGFKSIRNPADRFFLFSKGHKDLVDLFLKNNTGGPSIIFCRFAETGIIVWYYLCLLCLTNLC